MIMKNRLFQLFALFTLSLSIATARATADVKIVVSYTQVEHEIEPQNRLGYTARTLLVYLDKNKKLSVSLVSNNYGVAEGFLMLSEPKMSSRNIYRGDVSRARIDNGSILVVDFKKTHTIATRIRTDGVKSCSATRDYRLRHGEKIFRDLDYRTGKPLAFSTIEVRDVTCSISEVAR
jgi:hypothetical protein